jgi:hypothetical protein
MVLRCDRLRRCWNEIDRKKNQEKKSLNGREDVTVRGKGTAQQCYDDERQM